MLVQAGPNRSRGNTGDGVSTVESIHPERIVQDFWKTEACGSHFVPGEKGTPEFYRQYREFRYRMEWHIPLLVPFSEMKDKTVLEIGCGNGADGIMFAQAGAHYTGVDLTETAVEATRAHFRSLGLEGVFHLENAEQLSFADESFDCVYSYGVLHHTPCPANAFREVGRVLKPGGKAILMLYHKHSFNYYVRILGYMRLRILLRILSRMGHFSSDRAHLGEGLKGIRGNQDSSVWQLHYETFLRVGWSYLRPENFVHHATDGPECPFAFVYTQKMAREIFQNFSAIQTVVAYFPLRKYSIGKRIPLAVEKLLGALMGWYLFVYLTK